jgi:hypothetical protein
MTLPLIIPVIPNPIAGQKATHEFGNPFGSTEDQKMI